MSDLLPLAAYNLNIEPYTPTPAIDVTTPVTVRITMAAIDPEALDDEKNPSTLRIIKRNPDYDDEDDADGLLGDYDEDELDISEEEEEEEEKSKSKKGKGKGKSKKQEEEEEEEEEEEDEDEGDEELIEIDTDDEFQEFVLATLSPKTQYQQSLDIVIAPEEEVQFIVTGSYRVSLTGNYVKHPFDAPGYDDEDDDEEDDESYDEDEDDYLTPDEEADLEELEDASDVEAKIQELVEKEQSKSKKNNKRKQPEPEEEEEQKPVEETKKNKKAKKEKKVEFKKDLEEGPTKKEEKKEEKKEKPKTKVLEGGIIIEDRVTGKGKACKKGSKVGMRYIGKLKNGKVFDKNTSGKPFVFNLGRGEVIKGWDIGVAGMAVGGERRIVIPAPYAYGKQALPGIPANSELTFDVKLVSLK